jgi:hypothetical protein
LTLCDSLSVLTFSPIALIFILGLAPYMPLITCVIQLVVYSLGSWPSVHVLALLAVERYHFFCRPYKHLSICGEIPFLLQTIQAFKYIYYRQNYSSHSCNFYGSWYNSNAALFAESGCYSI